MVVSLAIGFGLTVLLLVAVFVVDRGGRPLFASVIFAAVALALTTFNLMFQAGNQGRLGKQVTIDSSGVLIESLLTQRFGRPAPLHLPADGLIHYLPDNQVAQRVLDQVSKERVSRDRVSRDRVMGDQVSADGERAGTGAVAGPLLRWVYAEQGPPTQHRILLGSTDATVRWHSIKLRNAAEFLDALKQLSVVPASDDVADRDPAPEGAAGDGPGADSSQVDLPTPGPTARVITAVGAVATMAVTVWLGHAAWPAMLLAAALTPLGLWYVWFASNDVLGRCEGAQTVTGRAVGHVVRSMDESSYRKSRRYVADVVVTSADGDRRLVKGAGGMTRCPLPNGSPVPVVPNRTGRPSHVIDEGSLGFTGRVSPMLVVLAIGVSAVWLLWVFDAIVGGL